MGDYNGIIVIKKEKGFTSHDVVAKLRGILRMKKIGHTGTLDPDATGVLPVALGKGTKLVELLTDKDKTYEAVLHLGLSTDTQDISGSVISSAEVAVSEDEVRSVIRSFVGNQMQIPPMYSALKVNGKKLYELAREGRVVEREPRPVCFYEIEILEIDLPFVRFRVRCSKGSYIRTLCNDIGEKLGCGGCMESLIRTGSGKYTLEQSYTLAQVEEAVKNGQISSCVETVEEVLGEYPQIFALPQGEKLLANGNPLSSSMVLDQHKEGWVRMYNSKREFVGIYQWDSEKNRYFPVKMF